MSKLLTSRRFAPLFGAQFLGAFNDNLYKNALTILLAYGMATQTDMAPSLLITIAAGLFMLPFFLFSATAGKLADAYEKSALIRRIKLLEVGLMVLASWALYSEHITFLMGVLFLLGAQSAFFGPLKYSILPDHLRDEELISGNALIETGTFLAILCGTIMGTLLILAPHGQTILSVLMIAMACIGWLASRAIPKAVPNTHTARPSLNIFRNTWDVMQRSRGRSDVFLSIIGISWFWFVGATFMAQFSVFSKEVLAADEQVVTLFLSIFSVGIGIGSMLCNRLLKGRVTGSYAARAALGMGASIIAFCVCVSYISVPDDGTLQSLSTLIQHATLWGMLVSLFAVAVCGGIYIVPLYAIMQSRTDTSECAQVIAANNIFNAFFMVCSALITLALLALGWSVADIFLALGIMNIPVAFLVHHIVVIEQAKNESRH